jgi:hypothetical protein
MLSMKKIFDFFVNVIWVISAIPAIMSALNTACTGIAVGSDKPALDASDNSTVAEAVSPALR